MELEKTKKRSYIVLCRFNEGGTIKEVTEKTYNPNVDDLGWLPNRRGIGDPYHRYSVFAVLLRFFDDVYEVPEGVMSPTFKEIVPLNP